MLSSLVKQGGLVAAIAAFVMLTNLGGARLWDRDEPRNAGCAREMLERHDWIVPTFNGELRTHKPVLLYWCMMASYLVQGVHEFSARLPSALAAIGSALCVYAIGRRLFGPRAGVWGGIALATSLLFVESGRAATPDSLLVFCSTLALAIFVMGTFRPRFDTTPADAPPLLHAPPHFFPQHWPTVAAMYAVMGLGVLAKGPVGLILPTAVIGMFLLIMRLPPREFSPATSTWRSWLGRAIATFEPLHFLTTCWAMRPATALLAAAIVAVPWYWCVGLATDGQFLNGFFVEHNLSRATSAMEGHSGFIFYYPLSMLVGFFPWSIFAGPLLVDTILQLRRRDQRHPGYILVVCWIGVYVVLFSVARTKLPSYVAPAYPALALLVGNYFDRFCRHATPVTGGWLVAAYGCQVLVGIGMAVLLSLVARRYLPGDEWLGLIGVIPLVGGLACLGLALVKNYRAAAGFFAASAVALALAMFSFATERVDRHQQSHVLLRAIESRSPTKIVSYDVLEPSWVFYGRRPIQTFTVVDESDRQFAQQHIAQIMAANPHSLTITTDEKLPEIAPYLPADTVVLERVPYFVNESHLVLLGHRHTDAAQVLGAAPSAEKPDIR